MADTIYEVAAREYDKVMVPSLKQILQGRGLFQKKVYLPPGSFNFDYKTITDMGAAIIAGEVPHDTFDKDMVKVTTTNLKLAVISKKWQLERATFEALRKSGYAIDTEAMLSAAYQVAYAEDTLLLQGWKPDGTNYVLNGLYQGAGNDFATTADFGTAGKAMLAVAGALALNYADNVFGVNYNLTLNPTQFNELAASVLASGALEMPYVEALLNSPNPAGPRGRILISNAITAATGLMSPVDPAGNFIDLVIGQDIRNVLAQEKFAGVSPIECLVYGVCAPRIKQSVAVCKLSSI